MPKTTTKPDRLKRAHDKLQAAVQSIVSGDDWQKMLQTAAKFHRYSRKDEVVISSPQGVEFKPWMSVFRSRHQFCFGAAGTESGTGMTIGQDGQTHHRCQKANHGRYSRNPRQGTGESRPVQPLRTKGVAIDVFSASHISAN